MFENNRDLVLGIDDLGWTALHVAADFDRKEIAEFLVSDRADMNARNEEGNTPLHVAALMGNMDVAETPIAKTANLSATNKRDE